MKFCMFGSFELASGQTLARSPCQLVKHKITYIDRIWNSSVSV